MNPDVVSDALNNVGIQLLSFILIIGLAYLVPFVLLSLIRVPTWLKNVASAIVMLLAMRYAFEEIFLV